MLAADLVWATAAAAGVSAVIVASEPAFLALRFAGAAYLIYLGARLLLAPTDKLLPAAPAGNEGETPARTGRARAFRQGFLCDMTNPKTLLVFTGVIPQFIAAGSSPFLPALLGVTFAGLGFGSLTLYSLVLAGRRRATAAEAGAPSHPRVRRNPGRLRGRSRRRTVTAMTPALTAALADHASRAIGRLSPSRASKNRIFESELTLRCSMYCKPYSDVL